MKAFYLTTAIDYANGKPHLGHAYEKVLADTIARHRRLLGDRVHFLTGLDEHGQKVQQSAKREGVEPAAYVDSIAVLFRDLCARLHISNDDYIRTTEPRHKDVVRLLLQRLFDQGAIYKGEYRGWYSARQEQFLLEKDRLHDGSWPEIFGEVVEIVEPNYFFRLRDHQAWLVEHIRTHEDFIFPRFRARQVLEFLKEPLNDLCISRPKERLSWGIPLPFDEGFVTYVWFDALLNYASAVWKDGAPDPAFWPADFNIIGKDILVPPHAVYWPIMLHAAGIEPPRALLVHGWWLKGGAKMSKSTGETVEPLDLVERHGVDAFRYFLMREMNVGQDSEFTHELFLARYNGDLANSLGNLLNRTLNVTHRYAGGVVPAAGAPQADGEEALLREGWPKVRDEVLALYADLQFHSGLDKAFAFIRSINRYAEVRAPWSLGKAQDAASQDKLRTCLATMAEALRVASGLLEPVMPTVPGRIAAALGLEPGAGAWLERLEWDGRTTGRTVAASAILFPRGGPAAPPAA